MHLSESIQVDLVAAMRSKDALRLATLRMMKTALTHRKVEKGDTLSEEEVHAVLSTLVKQRRESASQFRTGGRDEMAQKEEAEIAIIQTYLPAPATEDEIREAITTAIRETEATSPRDMGKVMKSTLAQLAGKTVDGGHVSALVKKTLQ